MAPSANQIIALNAALKAVDLGKISLEVRALIRAQKNLAGLARQIGVDRGTIYRAFPPNGKPHLAILLRIARTVGFQFIVVAESEQAESSVLLDAHTLTAAFQTFETEAISKACLAILRNRENITAFAVKAMIHRETLYRAFSRRNPSVEVTVRFLATLDLRLKVIPLRVPDPAQA